ncbi:hypothetical protein D3C87_1073130 [compost metagenome]
MNIAFSPVYILHNNPINHLLIQNAIMIFSISFILAISIGLNYFILDTDLSVHHPRSRNFTGIFENILRTLVENFLVKGFKDIPCNIIEVARFHIIR